MEFEIQIIEKEKWRNTRERVFIKRQIKSTELMDLAYLQHQSLNGLTNRENYIKNTCLWYFRNTLKPAYKGFDYKMYAIFQSKMNYTDLE